MQGVTIDMNGFMASSVELVFYILVLVFSLHAFFLGYHWIVYGEKRSVATTAIALYVGGGAVLLLTIAGSLYFF